MQPAVIILDMSTGYNWAPGSYGYDLVARVADPGDRGTGDAGGGWEDHRLLAEGREHR